MAVFLSFLLTLRHCARSRAVLQLELLALRHQLAVLKRSRPRRLRLAQAEYMVRRRQPPSQTWRTFLANHRAQLVAADFLVVPTATCRLLFVLVILAHERRRIVHVR